MARSRGSRSARLLWLGFYGESFCGESFKKVIFCAGRGAEVVTRTGAGSESCSRKGWNAELGVHVLRCGAF
jgi:hypothetical protein